MNVRLTKDQKIKIYESGDLYKVMQQILLRQNKVRRSQEHLWIAGLDNPSNLLFVELVAIGQVNRVNTHASDLFRMAIYKLATRVIIIHNHPSGSLEPSKSDMEFIDTMCFAGKIVDVKVIDSMIITEDSYTSFADKGIMPDKSDWNLELHSAMRQELEKTKSMVRSDTEIETSIAIATKMKELGIDYEAISKATGISLREIESL